MIPKKQFQVSKLLVEIFKGSTSAALYGIAQQWLIEVQAEQFGLDAHIEVHLQDLQKLVDGENSDLLVLATDDKKIVGYMGLYTFRSPIGPQQIANEHTFFVRPEHRGTGGLKLIRAAQAWAQAHQCTHLILNASKLASSLCERICEFYKRLGMKHFESSYIFRLE